MAVAVRRTAAKYTFFWTCETSLDRCVRSRRFPSLSRSRICKKSVADGAAARAFG